MPDQRLVSTRAPGPAVTLAAVVPATNAPPSLERCLAAIRAADEAPEELVVIDAPPFAGPAAARNAGAERAGCDVLVFVDADIIVHPDAFRRIRAAFADDPTLAAVFGAYDDEPTALGVVSAFRNLLHHHVHTTAGGPATTFWAGLGAMRREAFFDAGGFDADRFPHASIEDIDLGMRLVASGGRIVIDPLVQGTHLKAWSLGDMIRTDFARRGVPWAQLLARTGSAPTMLNLGWRHRASALASLAVFAALARRRPVGASFALLQLVLLNRSFYALLLRQRGPAAAAAAVALHAIHHVTGAAAAPVGITLHVRERGSGLLGRRLRCPSSGVRALPVLRLKGPVDMPESDPRS